MSVRSKGGGIGAQLAIVATGLMMIAVPVGYVFCLHYVRRNGHPDFLGFDASRAISESHLPVSVAATVLAVATLYLTRWRSVIAWVLAGVVFVWLMISVAASLLWLQYAYR